MWQRYQPTSWTIAGLLFAVGRIVLKVQDIQVSWAIVGALELVYWCVWAAYTPLVMGLAGTFIRPEAQQLGPLS